MTKSRTQKPEQPLKLPSEVTEFESALEQLISDNFSDKRSLTRAYELIGRNSLGFYMFKVASEAD
jgi:hypothetical protein